MKKIRVTAAALSALLLCGCGTVQDVSTVPENPTADSTQAPGTNETVSGEQSSESGYIPGERDENGVYVAEGYASKLNFPLDEKSITYAATRFEYVYEQYLRDNCENIYISIIPDKNYFLAERNGYPSLDYSELTVALTEKMSYAEYIDIFPLLKLSDYYRTDTHWRQEKITDVAAYIAAAMGTDLSAEYVQTELDVPFYGVHCRQADISLEPDTIIYLESEFLSECTVLDGETDSYIDVYNMELANEDDPYEIFLSGAKSLLTIENPNAATEKELVIFRDSFASSIAPLLAEGYAKITLVDIRYLSPVLLGRFVDFHGQDVLFLYSTLVLNNSVTIK